jgi:tRNA threonylcarbamoyladenosine biosynthesis protein TsaB
MLILTIRTDKPEAEIGLFENERQLAYETWPAHRELARTIHTKIRAALDTQGKTVQEIQGIVCFQGPGSFTGLRIGLTVGNTLAYGLGAPVTAARGEAWIGQGINHLKAGQNDEIVLPHYGAPVHITVPKK